MSAIVVFSIPPRVWVVQVVIWLRMIRVDVRSPSGGICRKRKLKKRVSVVNGVE
jgi:hypothetical protein